MIPVYNGKMTKAQMTGASLPEKHCSNGLGMGRTKTRRMDELIRALDQILTFGPKCNEAPQVTTARRALDIEKVKENIKEAPDSLSEGLN